MCRPLLRLTLHLYLLGKAVREMVILNLCLPLDRRPVGPVGCNLLPDCLLCLLLVALLVRHRRLVKRLIPTEVLFPGYLRRLVYGPVPLLVH